MHIFISSDPHSFCFTSSHHLNINYVKDALFDFNLRNRGHHYFHQDDAKLLSSENRNIVRVQRRSKAGTSRSNHAPSRWTLDRKLKKKTRKMHGELAKDVDISAENKLARVMRIVPGRLQQKISISSFT